jgi:nucleoside-diphosphate-sugar epimerase
VVTGASGWLGQHLVRALARERGQVRCLVPSSDEAPLLEIVGRSVEVVVGDVRDPAAIDRLFDGVAEPSVFHAAAIIHPRKAVRELFDVNVGGTQLVLDRSRRAGARRFVHVSSNSPFGANASADDRFTEDSPYHPYLGYGRSKLEAEQLVWRNGGRGDVATTIVRAPWFYGPHHPARQTQFLAAVRRGRFPLVGDGTQRRSLVEVGHLAQALLLAEAADVAVNRAYWVADAEPYELRAVLQGVRDAFVAEGFDVSDRAVPVPAAAAAVAAAVDAGVQALGRYVQAVHVLGEMKDTIACDVTRAREELGYEPPTSLVPGMRASIRWSLERGDKL